MRISVRPAAVLLALTFAVAACSTGATSAPPESAAASASAAPSESASAAVSESPSASASACTGVSTVSAGTLTIGTDNPAYPPYFQPPASGSPTKPWQLGDPTNGEGFEAAFAYALAQQMGFGKDQVTWTVVPFDNSYAPGAKKFDLDINQISYTPERAKQVDMSDGYYYLTQAVVALKSNPLAQAKTVSDLKKYRFGAQVGTTSYDTIKNVIAPTTKPSVYSTNDAAIQGLKAKQIDGLVVDLPTAFYITAAQLDNSTIVGQFPATPGPDAEHFSVVLQKGSALTACVNESIAALKADGTLDKITTEWLSDKANAPVFQP